MSTRTTAYPLCWPISYPRTKFRTESRFKKPHQESRPGAYRGPRRHTIDEALRFLSDELERLGATEPLLSSNLALRLDGHPKGGQSQPGDPGVCVYFKLNGKPIALPCDKWQHVECNIYALAKHIESLRGQNRWGVGSVERAFAGYLALEQQTQAKWFEVLEVKETASIDEIKTSRRAKVQLFHPDGSKPSPEEFNRVEEAFRMAMQIKA